MNLAVFYHCWLPNPDAVNVLCEQAHALQQSDLLAELKELHVGLNGDPLGSVIVQSLLPTARVQVDETNQKGEAHTIQLLQRWLPGHEDWAVCYHHIKGITHSPEDFNARWRRCLERTVIFNWRTCVAALAAGLETVGAHWNVPNSTQQYWAGNFWWATGRYLASLPPIELQTVNGKSYEAEVWIGKSGRRPRLRDYVSHPLMAGC